MGHRVTFTDRSAREIYETLVPEAIPQACLSLRFLNRQITYVMHKLHREVALKVLEGLEQTLRARQKDCWGVSFCTILMICLFIEKTQIAAQSLVVWDISKGDTALFDWRDRSQILNACDLLDDYPFYRSTELFHEVYRSHKAGSNSSSDEKPFNPLQMADNNCETDLDISTETMVKAIHGVLQNACEFLLATILREAHTDLSRA